MDKIKFYLPFLSFFVLCLTYSFIQSEMMNYITLDLGIPSTSVNMFNVYFLSLITANTKHIRGVVTVN